MIRVASSWEAFVRLPDGVELKKTGQTPSLVFATTKYGGYRIIMPCDAETQIRELTRHQTLRAAGKMSLPLNESLYDHLLHKWGRNTRNLKTLFGCEALEYFFEVVEIYSQEMLPYVLGCGEPPDEDAISDFQSLSGTLAEA
jgi:hypothetical protein